MKKILFFLLFAPLLSMAQKQVINDEHAEPRTLNASFHSIEVSNAIDLYISQNDDEGLAVSATDPAIRNGIKASVTNGVLKIWFQGEGKWWKNGGNRKMRAYVSFAKLTKLKASGASDVYVTGPIKLNELEIELSGASDCKVVSISASKLMVNLSGASDMVVNGGKVTDLKIVASGASDFKGMDMLADNCSLDASGASDIHVTVNNELNARATGSSGIYYKGEGKIKDHKSSGSSIITRRG